jgi:ABC-type nitrate/sulfonate/bicarbonate transport system substrate-binding protein
MKRGLKAGLTLSALASVLLVAGWLLRPEQSTSPPITVRLATIPGEISAHVWVAEEQGYFADQDLHMEITRYQTGAEATTALLHGKADFATCVEYVVVLQGFEHEDLRILAVLTTARFTEVVTRGSPGTTVPRDLMGKTIGVPRGTHVDYYLGRFLALHDIAPGKVTIVNLSPSEQLPAMRDNRVSAVIMFEPYLTSMKHMLGAEAVYWSLRDHDSYWLLVTRAATLLNSPSVAERILRAMVKAEEWLADNPGSARRSVRTSTSQKRELVVPQQYDFTVGLPQPLLAVMEEEARWVIENRLAAANSVPNYLDYLDFSALQRVKPRGVTLIR